MGEFSVKDKETYILIECALFGVDIESLYNIANDLQDLNGGRTVVLRAGNAFTMVLDGDQSRLHPQELNQIIR